MNLSEGEALASASQFYEFGEFRLDVLKRLLLRRNGVPMPLAPKVFDTLLYLVQHSGLVIEKERLIKAVWPDSIWVKAQARIVISSPHLDTATALSRRF
jgi:DNA-binding winged helix-turn-helix (wHTH) protein